ncbi:MAG: glycosyltransferase family 2 protein [Solirubrobacterales bacterium]
MNTSKIDVSVLVPVLDEAEMIEETAKAMRAQDLEGNVELIFLDGGCEDGTRPILEKLARRDDAIRIFDNPERRIPHALNIGLREARGEYVARMDAHTFYPSDYLATGIDRLKRGGVSWASGPQIAYGADRGSRAVALALRTRLGIGGAKFRFPVEYDTEVDTGFTGVWRRSTLEAFGGWDEGWPINEDAELAARVRERGGRIVCVPGMAARYVPRRSLRALARQYWRYGQYRAKTSRRHPRSMRRSHLIAPALVLTVVAAVAGPRPISRPARRLIALYGAVLAGETVRQATREPGREMWMLPAVLATMHVSWGTAFWVGAARFGPPTEAIKLALTRGGAERPAQPPAASE